VLRLSFLGGAGTVTGSKQLLESRDRRLLVDCGLFQGPRALRELNWAKFAPAPSSIDDIVLTHAHLDHCGYLPKLVHDGFQGHVLSTSATRAVAECILRDSAHLLEKDAEYANRKGYSRHKPALALYDGNDAERAISTFQSVPFGIPSKLSDGVDLTLRRAGHILGAATVEIGWDGRRMVFSGDLGRFDDPIMPDPQPVLEADYLVVESTYGDRRHDVRDPMEALGEVVDRTVRRGGTVVIPAFAVGRAQTLLYYLWKLKQGGHFKMLPIFLDSPMAIDAGDILCAHMDDHRMEASTCRAICGVATYVRDVEGSKAVTASPMSKVIISASGMATGGRVLHHIKAFGPDPRNTILFSGFQAVGTRGRALVDGASEVGIHGLRVPIRAEVADLSMLSAHADSDDILRWLSMFRRPPRRTFVNHGQLGASEALSRRIQAELGWSSIVPRHGEGFDL
jgi:metallo-beta-lactamase family protein